MSRHAKKPVPVGKRMKSYRDRMRAAGLKPVQIWVPDTKAPGFISRCQAQARAIARHDPAGDEAMQMIEALYEWPE